MNGLTRCSSSLSSTSTVHDAARPHTKSSKPSGTMPSRISLPRAEPSPPPEYQPRPETEKPSSIPFGIPIRPQRTLESSLATPLALILSHHPDPPSSPTPNPYPGSGTSEDPVPSRLVTWRSGNTYNWKSTFRWMITAVIALSTLCIVFASSSYSAAIEDILVEFPGTSKEVGITGISVYVLGEL